MRGRLPSGPEYVEQLPGSATAKERVQAVLETLAGTCRVQEACARLGICEQRFEQLRRQVLEAAVERLEPRAAGRPPRLSDDAEEKIQALRAQVAFLERQVELAQVRTEVALILPNAVRQAAAEGPSATAGAHEKKKTRRRRRRH
jgi:hypothetical protein